MALRAILLGLLSVAVLGAGGAAANNFLVMQKTPPAQLLPVPGFCAGKKDQDYCSDAHTLMRCKAGNPTTRIFCPAGCTQVLNGGAICNGG